VESERHFKGGPGDLLCDRYEISKEVGVGTFGRVFECYDSKRQKVVAVKVIRDVRKYYDSALIEADILQDVNGRGGRGKTHCVQLYAHFDYKRHFCLAFESMGKSLYDVIRLNNYKGFPLNMVRDFARQLLEALQFLHSMGLVHTDLKPENILLCTKELSRNRYGMSLPESTRIKRECDLLSMHDFCLPVAKSFSSHLPGPEVIDFGGATYTDDRKSSIINTRQYRAPEVILELGWCTPSDLWSAGCIVSELYEGELLFATVSPYFAPD
jgi:serine/threonine protein kinase